MILTLICVVLRLTLICGIVNLTLISGDLIKILYVSRHFMASRGWPEVVVFAVIIYATSVIYFTCNVNLQVQLFVCCLDPE